MHGRARLQEASRKDEYLGDYWSPRQRLAEGGRVSEGTAGDKVQIWNRN